ncbi:ankyrin repeat domain-containing protein 61-like [Salvelinus alpinus]
MNKSGNSTLNLADLVASNKPVKALGVDLSCTVELLDQGADPNTVNHAGHMALHEACSEGHKAVLELLLKYGANVNQLTDHCRGVLPLPVPGAEAQPEAHLSAGEAAHRDLLPD